MKKKVKFTSGSLSLVFLGIILILLPFINSKFDGDSRDVARLGLLISIGMISLIFGVTKYLLKEQSKLELTNSCFAFLTLYFLIEGISFFSYSEFGRGSFVIVISLLFFFLRFVFGYLKAKDNSNLIDKYLEIYLSFALILLSSTYFIYSSILYIDTSIVLAIIVLTLTIMFAFASIIFLCLKENETIKFNVSAFKNTLAVSSLILFGVFYFLVFTLIYWDVDYTGIEVYKYGNLIIGLISIALGVVLYFMLRKKKIDDFYVYSIFSTLIAISSFVIFFFRNGVSSVDLFILRLLACILPCIIYFLKFVLSEVIELPIWTEIIIVICNLEFFIGSGIPFVSSMFSLNSLPEPSFYITYVVLFGTVSMAIPLIYNVIHILEIIKGNRL